MNNLNKEYNDRIYNEIYLKIDRKYTEIFLCGGASTNENKSYRDLLKETIIEKSSGKIRVLYPENLFMEILVTKKDSNLLELEKYLAKHSDLICIVCESPGSFVELGVFSTSLELKDKVLVFVNKQYEKKRSFINMGPIKHLRGISGPNSVYYYNDDMEETYKSLIKIIKSLKKSTSKELNTIINISYFLQILLFFKKRVEFKEILEYIEYKCNENIDTIIINSALKLMFSENILLKDGDKRYSLTKKGYSTLKNDLRNIGVQNSKINELRMEYLKMEYYPRHGTKNNDLSECVSQTTLR
ncbi:retron St85 family effector protein [Cetobacterium somerae]